MSHDSFDGLASTYDEYRPDYPEQLFERMFKTVRDHKLQIEENAIFIDVGAGTGISTRLLKKTFGNNVPVIGIEPGSDMIKQAVQQSHGFDNLCYLRGTAESLCFNKNTVDFILVAQAVQWFSRQAFYAEASRVLKKKGMLAIVQNNRNWEDSNFLGAYESFLEKYSEGYSRYYRSFNIREELSNFKGLVFLNYSVLDWTRSVSKHKFIGMANSSTKYHKAQKEHGGLFIDSRLRELVDKHFLEDEVKVNYKSELYMAVRK